MNGVAWLDSVEMGVGAWAWGDKFFWGYGRGYSEADARSAFAASLNGGITFFDTAESYGQGRSERLVGKFARAVNRPILIATKFMPYPWRMGRGNLLKALQNSLKRLGLKQVDLYQIHFPTPPAPVERYAEGLADAVEAGLTRSVGVSNYNLDQMRRTHETLARRGIPLASNQVEYSLLQRDPERSGLLAACRELNVRLIAYSPLAKGLLTGKYTPGSPPPFPRNILYRRKQVEELQPLIALLGEIGRVHGGKTPAQVALNWTICKGTLPIPGAKNPRQAEQNAGALGWRLTEEQIAALDAASEQL